MYCCGSNQFGQLGLGDKTGRTTLTRLTFEDKDDRAVRSKRKNTPTLFLIFFSCCFLFYNLLSLTLLTLSLQSLTSLVVSITRLLSPLMVYSTLGDVLTLAFSETPLLQLRQQSLAEESQLLRQHYVISLMYFGRVWLQSCRIREL